MSTLEAVTNRLIVAKARRHPEHEQSDLCTTVEALDMTEDDGRPQGVLWETHTYPDDPSAVRKVSEEWKTALLAAEGEAVPFGGKVLRDVPGMGRVYDWRGTSWTASFNHGRIKPLLGIEHIPVVPNMAGIADFIRLHDVLVNQGLGIHSATDRSGNVAWFQEFDRMAYQARGANQFSWGNENMHLTLGEEWTLRQLRAAAWLVNQSEAKYGIPTYGATLTPGDGIVGVKHKGQATHEAISHYAGYDDRSDPGAGYRRAYVSHCVRWYRDHNGSFVGA